MSKKILFVLSKVGINSNLQEHIKILQTNGFSVHVISDGNLLVADKQFDISMGILKLKSINKIRKIMEAENYDLIISQTKLGGFCGRIAAWRAKKIPVLHVKNDSALIEKLLLPLTDALVICEKKNTKKVKKIKLRGNGKTYYIPDYEEQLVSKNSELIKIYKWLAKIGTFRS